MTNFQFRLWLSALLLCGRLCAQTPFPDGKLDPTRHLAPAVQPAHEFLAEEYLWTAGEATVDRSDRSKFPWSRQQLRNEPHFFRGKFNISTPPPKATLYLAGPRQAIVHINGKIVENFKSDIDAPIGFHVFRVDVTSFLSKGANVIAIEAVRGRGIVAGAGPKATQQLAYGEVLAAKIIGAGFGTTSPVLAYSNASWKSTTTPAPQWSDREFDDSLWKTAQTLGPVESKIDFFQWNGDAGMYEWPGYSGMSTPLRTYSLQPVSVSHLFPGNARMSSPDDLTDESRTFTVRGLGAPTDSEAPGLLLDFGREVAGRLLVESSSACEATLSVAYGESEIEAMSSGLSPGQQGGNYLGTNLLHVPENGIARGPKSAFRYVRIRFLRGCDQLSFKAIRLEGIYYPVSYTGSFESSDPLLNRIWETGAYTVHLCMQDGLWDAPKRDRGRWVGDMDVEAPIVLSAFGDSGLLEDTLHRLVPAANEHVNGIPSYSALWVTSLEALYLRNDDRAFLISQHDNLVRILSRMDADLDSAGLFNNAKHQWLFVDWAPGLYGYTAEAVIGTQLQYVRAYKAAAKLFQELGDSSNATKYRAQADKAMTATRIKMRDPGYPTYGTTWQLNALALLTENDAPPTARGQADAEGIWQRTLRQIKQDSPSDGAISPYFNAYLIDALGRTGHAKQALEWIRQYWGGMLAEGATSFWESYDLRWPKTNPHLSLQADGTAGYFVSMAHGWSAGPTAWLSEHVLGIRPLKPGYRKVSIAPDLMGLEWAQGSVATPTGPIKVRIGKDQSISLDLPAGVDEASVSVPIPKLSTKLLVNGRESPSPKSASTNSPDRIESITLKGPGHFLITFQ